MIIRNWRDSSPHISHKYGIEWTIFMRKDAKVSSYFEKHGVPGEQKIGATCLETLAFVEYAFIQPGKTLEEHINDYYEEIYFIIKGTGVVVIDGRKHKIREGDAIYLPKKTRHGIVNDSEDTINYLIFAAGEKHPEEFL